jgi:hypothetical protein
MAHKYSENYRLHCKVVDVNGAKNAINAGRVVVVDFGLEAY